MKRFIIAAAVLATLALSVPADAHAGGFLGRLFGRGGPPAQRNFNLSIGGGRGIAINRSVVRGAAPVVVQQVQPAFQVVQQRRVVVQQAVPVYAPAQVQQFQVQQFRAVGGY